MDHGLNLSKMFAGWRPATVVMASCLMAHRILRKNLGMRPMELVLAGLGGAQRWMSSILRKQLNRLKTV